MTIHKGNPRCDGIVCREKDGEVRILPVIRSCPGNALHLCRACNDKEIKWRKEKQAKGYRMFVPVWSSLRVKQ